MDISELGLRVSLQVFATGIPLYLDMLYIVAGITGASENLQLAKNTYHGTYQLQ